MPELPEVEAFNKYFHKNALNKKIRDVQVEDAKLVKTSVKDLQKATRGKLFKDTYRRGKHLFGKLDSGEVVVFHFGMTGYFVYTKDEPPPYSRVRFVFDNEHLLAFVIKRKLGNVDLTSDIEEYCEKKNLGPDALQISKDDFVEIFSKRTGKVKSALMDQSLVSGVGNIYSDEALFQSGILPDRTCKTLTNKELGQLYNKLQHILSLVTKYREKGDKLPATYLANRRKNGADCPKCKGKVKKKTINGRSSYFCPSCQK